MRRRGHGEGSVFQRPDGRWTACITLPRGTDGRRRRKYVYAATQAEVTALLRRHGGRAIDGQLTTTSTPTVRVLLEQWLAVGLTAKGKPWRPSTRRGYTPCRPSLFDSGIRSTPSSSSLADSQSKRG